MWAVMNTWAYSSGGLPRLSISGIADMEGKNQLAMWAITKHPVVRANRTAYDVCCRIHPPIAGQMMTKLLNVLNNPT